MGKLKNGEWFYKVLSRSKLVEKCVDYKYVVGFEVGTIVIEKKNGKRLRKFRKKGWEFRKNGVRFLEVLSRPMHLKKKFLVYTSFPHYFSG